MVEAVWDAVYEYGAVASHFVLIIGMIVYVEIVVRK